VVPNVAVIMLPVVAWIPVNDVVVEPTTYVPVRATVNVPVVPYTPDW